MRARQHSRTFAQFADAKVSIRTQFADAKVSIRTFCKSPVLCYSLPGKHVIVAGPFMSFPDKVVRIRAELLGAASDMPAAQVVAVVRCWWCPLRSHMGIFLASLEPKSCPHP